MTITEALSEINLIKKKLADKRTQILGMLVQAEHVPDPYVNDGGSARVVSREMQAIDDLSMRLMRIRAGISKANLATSITVEDGGYHATRTIHDWLIWKREIAKDEGNFLANLTRTVKGHLDTIAKQPQVYKDEAGNIALVKTKLNVDYPKFVNIQAEVNNVLEKLDGQLSLKNATVTIDMS